MPRVPITDSFQAAPNTLPQAQATAVQMPDLAGTQAQQLGQGLGQAGQQLGRVALQLQQEANQLRVDDALNQVKEQALRLTFDQEQGYSNLRGINALERPDGRPLADEYGGTLQEAISKVSQGLGNEEQRRAFSAAAGGILTNFRGQITKHEADEFRTYSLSVAEGVQATALREIALSWDNPEAIDAAVLRIRAQTYRQGQMLGKSAEWQEAQVRQMVSTAHKTALAAALDNNDVLYADRYLQKYANQMQADDILNVRGHITKAMDLQVGENIGAQVFASFAPDVQPGDFTRLTGIVMGIESSGRRFDADGKLLEGPQTRYGTAKGEMQVLDGTNTDPGFGVKPARDNSPDERARVGRDYLAAMLKRYDGDVPKTLAAYNWGPGNLDAALKEHGEQWLSHAPKETRDYVARGAREFGAGMGAARKPTLSEMRLALREQPELAGNPQRLKYAEDRLAIEHKALLDAAKQQEDETLDSAYRSLYANGGDFSALPGSLRTQIPGQKLNSVLEFARQIARDGGVVHQPEAWAQILTLPRSELAAMSPIDFYRQFRPVLDDSHLEKGYALLENAKGVDKENHLEIITTAQRVKQNAIAAGIIPADEKPSKDETKAFARFNQAIDEQVRQFERVDLQGKRKANSEELQQIIDRALLDKAFVPRSFWFDKEQPLSVLTPEDQSRSYVRVEGEDIALGSIPADQRMTIATKLQARGLPVTEQAIADLWVRAGKPK